MIHWLQKFALMWLNVNKKWASGRDESVYCVSEGLALPYWSPRIPMMKTCLCLMRRKMWGKGRRRRTLSKLTHGWWIELSLEGTYSTADQKQQQLLWPLIHCFCQDFLTIASVIKLKYIICFIYQASSGLLLPPLLQSHGHRRVPALWVCGWKFHRLHGDNNPPALMWLLGSKGLFLYLFYKKLSVVINRNSCYFEDVNILCIYRTSLGDWWLVSGGGTRWTMMDAATGCLSPGRLEAPQFAPVYWAVTVIVPSHMWLFNPIWHWPLVLCELMNVLVYCRSNVYYMQLFWLWEYPVFFRVLGNNKRQMPSPESSGSDWSFVRSSGSSSLSAPSFLSGLNGW